MGISSARPDNLDRFARKSRELDHTMVTTLRRVLSDYHAFLEANHWGVFEADSLLGAFSRYTNGNAFTARWVANIAARFRAAGGGAALVRLPDSAIKASLKAAGLDHGRHHATFDKPVAYGSPPTTGYTDDPVNTATGNFVEVEGDLRCGGLVAGLTFERTYNSRSDRVGPFGCGWSSWASARLVPGPEGAAYVGPDGQEAVFPRLGDGYGRVVGVAAVVEPLESGLALRWLGGAGRWVFDGAGRPAVVSDGPGTEIRLERDADGRLAGMSHAGGKHVRLEWDEDAERVIGLACSDGRSTAYRYDASGNLVEAEGAAGARRYEVDETGRVASVIDADGVVELVNAYDDDGRVTEQLSPFGRRTRLFYLPGGVTVTMDDDEDHPANTFVHDAQGRLTAVIAGDEQQLSTGYDEWGNPTAVTERNGAVTIQEYDERGLPVRRALPTGVVLTFARDDADRLVEVAVGDAVTRYVFDGDERSPSQITDPEGGVTRQDVRDGLVRRIVDPDGVTVEFEHDADGNVIGTTDGDGNHTRLERDDAGRVTALVSPLGRRTAFFYDQRGELVERHDPAGGVWRFDRTAAGRLTSVTDPTGAREEIRYGEHGRTAATVDALGHVATRDYDVFGNLVGVVEPDGTSWRYTYDALMRWTETVDPAGAIWQRRYDVNGTLIASTDPVGTRTTASVDAYGRVVGLDDGLVVTEYELDELGRLVGCGLSDGTYARTEYDRCGRRTLVEDAAGGVLRIEYTAGGRIRRQVSPEGREESLEHDACGRVSAHVDGAGRRTELRYDADGAVIEVLMATGESERFEYDELGLLSQTSAPGAGLTRYAYDAVGRVVAIVDREAGERRFEYDAAGRLVAVADANGDVTRYAYNERGWLVEITDPLGGTLTRGYDAAGRLVEQTDQLGRHTTFTVDAAGKLVELADATGQRTTYAYDISGRMISFGPAGEPPHTIAYDGAGRTIAVQEPGALSHRLRWDAEGRLVERSRGDLALRWTYDADGDRTSIGYPDGTQTTYTRDRGGRVVAAHHPALGAIELERDPAGRLVGASADGMRASWRYAGGDLERYELHAGDARRSALLARDASGRITRATIDGRAHEFSHDAAGQLVSAHAPAGAWEFAYDANGRLARELSPSGAVTYEYDAAGQLERRTEAGDAVTSYEYDGAGRRVRERGPALEREYAWDAIGRLTGVTRRGAGGEDPQTTSVVVDVLGELASLDGTAMMWDTADPFAPLAWRGEEAVIGEGSPWATASAGAGRWLAPDWQGTIGDAARDPWGAAGDAGGGLGAGLGLGYRGEVEFDGETWLRRRVYQAATRSFPQPDPYPPEPGTASAANPYHYAANDPIGRADPLGLHPVGEKQLNAIRDRMDRGLLDEVADAAQAYVEIQTYPLRTAGKLVVDNASTISAATGVLALVPGPQMPFLAGISIGTGAISATKAGYKGEYGAAALDLAAIVPGAAGFKLFLNSRRGVTAARAANTARLANFGGDSLATQYAKQLAVKHQLHAAHKAHLIGKGLDVVAAGGATAIALKPHGEHVPYQPHHPHLVQPHPVHP